MKLQWFSATRVLVKYYKINGKAVNNIYNKDAYIGLPYYRKPGEKASFCESNTVNLSISNDDNFYEGRTGGMEITKANSGWVEGIFHFTAASKVSAKTFDVTDGFFRISVTGKP